MNEKIQSLGHRRTISCTNVEEDNFFSQFFSVKELSTHSQAQCSCLMFIRNAQCMNIITSFLRTKLNSLSLLYEKMDFESNFHDALVKLFFLES